MPVRGEESWVGRHRTGVRPSWVMQQPWLKAEAGGGFPDEGKLTIIQTDPPLPPVPYMAMYRNDRPSAFVSEVAMRAVEQCDFSRQLQS